MFTQRIVITDARGRTATVEVQLNEIYRRYLRTLTTGSGYPNIPENYQGHWRALTLGAFGSQCGGLELVPGTGDRENARAEDLILTAQLRNGVHQYLVILKRWHMSRGLPYQGTGTLYSGVNLGLQSGEITWSIPDGDRHYR